MSVTFTEACGMHAASWAFEAVRRSWVIVGACEARACEGLWLPGPPRPGDAEARACEGLWLAAPALPVTMPAMAAVQAAAERMVRRDINGPPGRWVRSWRRTGVVPYSRSRVERRMRASPAGAAASRRFRSREGPVRQALAKIVKGIALGVN